jgi:hypothetical protein
MMAESMLEAATEPKPAFRVAAPPPVPTLLARAVAGEP